MHSRTGPLRTPYRPCTNDNRFALSTAQIGKLKSTAIIPAREQNTGAGFRRSYRSAELRRIIHFYLRSRRERAEKHREEKANTGGHSANR